MFFILTVGFISCGQNVEKAEKKFLTNAVDQLKIDGEYEWIVVLPGLGCHGCIQEGEFFMKENISNKKILFVLTNIVSLKILQQKMDITIGDNPNIYVDRSNQFKLTTDNSIYPCIIRLKSGKIEQFEFQSPQNAAFHKMKKQLE
jgi:hypothetical protein